MAKVIGIDLGTTYTVVSCMENNQAMVIPNADGNRLTPSIVAFTSEGKRLVGDIARRQAIINPERTIASIKRRMGTDFRVNIDGKEYTPQEISAMILQKVKADAEKYLNEKIEKAVITVPAYFNDRQREATREAGIIAGLEVMRIISEPTAASLAYGLDKEDIQTILVWDLGGGTFDVSILELSKGVFEVKAVNGNTWLGGDDWDLRIINYLADEFQKENGLDLRENIVALQRLKEVSEKAKIELSSKLSTNIRLPFVAEDENESKHLNFTLSREKFEEMTSDLLMKMIAPTNQALADAGLDAEEIDKVILVGGSTRMPAVRRLIKKITGKNPYININPDEAVSIGAAIQAGVLTGEVKDIVLVDVTPLSLGIDTQGEIFAKIVERNTTIPTSRSQIFTTADDNQTTMDIHVLQGEREISKYNMSLGKFQLRDIPPLSRGDAQVEVVFEIDANGIINVVASDLHTESKDGIKITSPVKLSENEIKRMIKEAEEHQLDDREEREKVEIKIKANNTIYAAQKTIEESKKMGEQSEVFKIKEAIRELKKALANGGSKKINLKSKNLEKICKPLYQKALVKKP